MSEQIENAWADYQADALTDPMYRYSHDHKAIFRAGYAASQKKHVGVGVGVDNRTGSTGRSRSRNNSISIIPYGSRKPPVSRGLSL